MLYKKQMSPSAETRSPPSNRWGILGNSTTLVIGADISPSSSNFDNAIKPFQWEDFDHSKTLDLAESGSTSIVYHRTTGESFVLRVCVEVGLTYQKKLLVAIAGCHPSSSHFLSTACVFTHDSNYYVGSELSQVSLEDIIECSIPVEEGQISTILCQVHQEDDIWGPLMLISKQIAQALQYLYECSETSGTPLIYGSLQPSNIFINQNGDVRLGKTDL
jgi:hypothetical protein